MRGALHLPVSFIVAALAVSFTPPARAARLKELVEVEGFRQNQLTGLGLVVGLHGTGDDTSSMATRRGLAEVMKHLGSVIDPNDVRAKNVALVTVQAALPPFARPGLKVDVTVSSLGNATSLQGGSLITTPLKGFDRQVYALAQGPLVIGGFSAGGQSGSSSAKNHVTVGRIASGAMIERDAPAALPTGDVVLLLRDPDFTTAARISVAIGAALGEGAARIRDPAAVMVPISDKWKGRVVELVAELEKIDVTPDSPGRVVIDERTGTVVVGENVTLGPAAIASGGLRVDVAERPTVSQAGAFANGGRTERVAQTEMQVEEKSGAMKVVPKAGTVGDVAAALNALGVKPRDLLTVLQALKAAGALRAELEVL